MQREQGDARGEPACCNSNQADLSSCRQQHAGEAKRCQRHHSGAASVAACRNQGRPGGRPPDGHSIEQHREAGATWGWELQPAWTTTEGTGRAAPPGAGVTLELLGSSMGTLHLRCQAARWQGASSSQASIDCQDSNVAKNTPLGRKCTARPASHPTRRMPNSPHQPRRHKVGDGWRAAACGAPPAAEAHAEAALGRQGALQPQRHAARPAGRKAGSSA